MNVSFNAGTLTLLSNTAGTAAENVSVKAGTAYTDILVNGKYLTRMNGVTGSTISTIDFNGAGGVDTLSVSGIATALTVDLNDAGTTKLQLNTGATGVTTTVTSDNGVTLLASNVAGPLTLTATAGDVTQSGAVNVAGTTTITATAGAINLNNTNNAFGTLVLTATTGAGNVTIKENGPTNFGNTDVGGNFLVVSSGAITDTGTLNVEGTTSVTSNGNSITLDGTGTGADFNGNLILLKGTDVTIKDKDGDTTLVTVTATTSLTATSTTGAIIHTSGNINVGGLANFQATTAAKNITLTGGSNNFGSIQTNAGGDVSIIEKSATDLFTTNAGSSLTVTSSGAITDSGVVTVGTTTSLSAAGNPITLDSSTSTFAGSITFVKGTNIALTDSDGATNITNAVATGNLSLTSTGGGAGVSDTGILTVAGRLTVTATGEDIILNSAGNKFGSISVFGKVVTLVEADASDIYTSTITDDFSLTSGGAVTDSGVITQSGGDTTISANAGAKNITLDSTTSTFTGGSLIFTGFNVAVTDDDGATVLGATTANGNYTVTSTGAGAGVSQTAVTGIQSVTGRFTVLANDVAGKDIILNTSSNEAGSISFFGDDVSFDESDPTNIYTTSAASTFTLTSGGAVTDSGDVSVGTVTDIAATGNITLDSPLSTYVGNVKLDGVDVTLFNDTATSFDTTSTTGFLKVTSVGDINDNGTITVATTSLFKAIGFDITLNDTTNTFGPGIGLFGVNGVLTPDTQNVVLATSKLTGTLDLTAEGDITQTGVVKVDGVTTLTTNDPATQSITLNAALNTFGQLKLTAFNATITEFGETDLGESTLDNNLTVTSSGGISDSGTLTVTGDAKFTAQDGDILLADGSSVFGSLNLIGNNVDVMEDNSTLLKGVSTPGSFTLTSGGSITQNGSLSVGGDAIVSAAAAINLNETGGANNFGTIAFTSTGATTIHESSNTDLEASSSGAALEIYSLGNIDANGVVTAVGATDLKAGATGTQSIDVSKVGSQFGDLKVRGSTVTINDADATKLQAGSTVTGAFTLTSGGNVTQDAGAVVVGGLLTVSAPTFDITLDDAADEFQSLALVAANATINDSDAGIILTTSNITSTFILTLTEADGDVTDADLSVITVGTLTKITTNGGDITLDEVDSVYTKVVLVGANIEVNSYSGLTLGNGAGQNVNALGTLTIRTFNSGAITQSAGAVITATDDAFIFADGALTLTGGAVNTFNGIDNHFFSNGAEVF